MSQAVFYAVLGLLVGAGAVGLVVWVRRRAGAGDRSEAVEALKGTFAQLSQEALSRNNDAFLALAGEKLRAALAVGDEQMEGKKKLIDQTLGEMKKELAGVQEMVRALEKDRENKFGELSASLASAAQQTSKLQQAADQLNSVLSNTKQRGHLGEKLTEDILRLVGFVENVNYTKQEIQGEGRPDYTFLLPRDL